MEKQTGCCMSPQFGANANPLRRAIALVAALAPAAVLAYPPTDDPILAQIRPLSTNIVTYAAGQPLPRPPDVPIVDPATAASGNAPALPPPTLPDERLGVMVPKGSYKVVFTEARDVNLFGETGNPADVEIWSDAKGSGGTIHALGPMYVEGVTIATKPGPDGTGPKYPLHLTYVHRFFRASQTTIFANCRFVANTSFSGPPGNVMGMDGFEGTYTLFYKCELKGVGTNMHGWQSNKKPLTLAYVNCKSDTSVGFNDLGAGSPDKIYAIDCEFPEIDLTGAPNATLYISEGSKIGVVKAANVVTNSAWPIPTRGLAPDDPAVGMRR